jgi:hypothetical protein
MRNSEYSSAGGMDCRLPFAGSRSGHGGRRSSTHLHCARRLLLTAVLGFSVGAVRSGTYWTAPDGDDTHPGTEELPWRTVQKAAQMLQPGDTVMVRDGVYEERVITGGGGTESAPVAFVADGVVEIQGFRIQHPHVVVRGFEIRGWSAATSLSAHVEVVSSGSFFEMTGCTMRDGIQIVRNDMVFSSAGIISSVTGGFLAAGFAPGQSVYIGRGDAGPLLANRGSRLVTAVTDNALTVEGEVADEGPVAAYLSGALVYGLVLRPGSEGCVIRGNTFRNLAFDTWFIMGSGHLLEDNLIERVNGWDAMHFGGTDHVFHRNIIRDSPQLVIQASPDALENYTPVPYARVVFTNNVIEGFDGVLAAQKGGGQSTDLLLTRNVFIDVGRLNLTHPYTTIEQNTFLRVARTNHPVVSVASHPIRLNTTAGATNCVIRNNIFVDCGQPTPSTPYDRVGWYELNGPDDTVVAEGNFVAGAGPDYPPKTTWPEPEPLLNGGDPGFVNILDPFGPDGLPFTEDDGLRLRPDSKLRGAGVGGLDVGAYQTIDPDLLPDLWVAQIDAPLAAFAGETITLSWTVTNAGAGPAAAIVWYDDLYLSPNDFLDEQAFPLASVPYYGGLDINSAYSASSVVLIPPGLDGEFHFLVHTDARTNVFEQDLRTNNVTATLMPTQITLPSNTPPVFDPVADQVVDELAELTLTLRATDTDLPPNQLVYALLQAPEGMTLDELTGVLSWTPTEAQGPEVYDVIARVTDDGEPPLSDTVEFRVTVREVNTPPVFDPVADQVVDELAELTLTLRATDTDLPPNQLLYALLQAPEGMTLDELTGVLSWTPTEAQGPEVYDVIARVTDDGQPPLSDTVEFRVTVREVNTPPVFDPVADQVVDELAELTLTLRATDTDLPPNQLVYALLQAPEGMTLDELTGVLSGGHRPTLSAGSRGLRRDRPGHRRW